MRTLVLKLNKWAANLPLYFSIIIFSSLAQCGSVELNKNKELSDQEALHKANQLVGSLGRLFRVYDAMLDSLGKRSFGEAGVVYDQSKQVLIGRVFVAKLRLDLGEEQIKNWDRTLRGLNNPEIGGMFETGGGYFYSDKSADNGRGMLFLVKEFPVANTGKKHFRKEMENLMNLAPVWTMDWLIRVAQIADGREPKPKRYTSRKDRK